MSRSGCVQPKSLAGAGERLHKALRASHNRNFLSIIFFSISNHMQRWTIITVDDVSSSAVSKIAVSFADLGQYKCIYWPFRLLFEAKQNLWKDNHVIYTEGFESLWTRRVSPICISTSVSHDPVYPVKADLLSVVLFQEVFWHLCVCLHDGVWRLIRFLPLHTWPVWHNRQSRCLGSTQGIRRSTAESN